MSMRAEDIEGVKQANQRFYDAFGALDVAALDEICVDSEQALCIHPGWQPLVGWETIRESWRRIFDNTTLMHFNIRYINVVVEGDCGWVTCVEGITSVLAGQGRQLRRAGHQHFCQDAGGLENDRPPRLAGDVRGAANGQKFAGQN